MRLLLGTLIIHYVAISGHSFELVNCLMAYYFTAVSIDFFDHTNRVCVEKK